MRYSTQPGSLARFLAPLAPSLLATLRSTRRYATTTRRWPTRTSAASTRSATARRAGSARAVPRRTIAGQRAAFIAYARPATALQRITARVRAHPCLERCGMGCTLGSRTSMLFPFCNGFQGRYKLCVPAMCIKEVLIHCYTTCPGCGSIWEARRASKGRAIGLV